jgi:hypothetical protein
MHDHRTPAEPIEERIERLGALAGVTKCAFPFCSTFSVSLFCGEHTDVMTGVMFALARQRPAIEELLVEEELLILEELEP